MNEPTLCAALLHDTVEDRLHAFELSRDFGEEVALLRRRLLTKIDRSKFGETAAGHRKMIVAMSRTSGCWYQASTTGCTTCGRCTTSGRTSGPGSPRTLEMPLHWPIASASMR